MALFIHIILLTIIIVSTTTIIMSIKKKPPTCYESHISFSNRETQHEETQNEINRMTSIHHNENPIENVRTHINNTPEPQ